MKPEIILDEWGWTLTRKVGVRGPLFRAECGNLSTQWRDLVDDTISDVKYIKDGEAQTNKP